MLKIFMNYSRTFQFNVLRNLLDYVFWCFCYKWCVDIIHIPGCSILIDDFSWLNNIFLDSVELIKVLLNLCSAVLENTKLFVFMYEILLILWSTVLDNTSLFVFMYEIFLLCLSSFCEQEDCIIICYLASLFPVDASMKLKAWEKYLKFPSYTVRKGNLHPSELRTAADWTEK